MNIAARILVVLLLPLSLQAAPGGGSDRARAYLKEVRELLTTCHIECDTFTQQSVAAAGVKGMIAALEHPDFAAVPAETRAAVRKALEAETSLMKAFDAAAAAAPELDFVKLADHAAAAMVRATGDPFSKVLTAEEMRKLRGEMKSDSEGESLGIAAQVREGRCVVAYVRYGFAAYEEGLRIGDEILAVDGKPVKGQAAEEVNARFKLSDGSKTSLTFLREGMAEPATVLLCPSTKPRAVQSAMIGDGVGYVRMTQFGQGLKRQTKKALGELKKQGMERLVLDLRHNPGGMVTMATAVADLFLPQELTITDIETRMNPPGAPPAGDDEEGEPRERTITSQEESPYEELPMVVLIDEASASASELLAGALQDHKRARLVGRTSFGKGVGQTAIPLSSTAGGDAAPPERFLYLTVMRYLLPGGRNIHHVGIVPDVEIAQPRVTGNRLAGILQFRAGGKAETWAGEVFAKDRAALETFAMGGVLPEIGETLRAGLSAEDLATELRRAARRRLEREGMKFVFDLGSDLQLQAALKELKAS